MDNFMADYGILGWIIIGGIAGAIAKLIMPGRDPGGIIVTILLGIAGAVLAGFIGQAVGWYSPGEGAGFIAAIVGALLLLFLYRMIAGRRTTGTTDRRL
jgi:uncharacterized membrane protein YeaQ/YmgE (transglycosylase-associated protein family)